MKCCSTILGATLNALLQPASMRGSTCGAECHTEFVGGIGKLDAAAQALNAVGTFLCERLNA